MSKPSEDPLWPQSTFDTQIPKSFTADVSGEITFFNQELYDHVKAQQDVRIPVPGAIFLALAAGPALTFDVVGTPKGEPRPSPSRRGARSMVHPGHQADDWKRSVRLAALAALELERAPVAPVFEAGVPLLLVLELRHARPKTRQDAAGWMTSKPDVDNEAKAVMDALGVWPKGALPIAWKDDQQVVALLTWKRYESQLTEGEPGASVAIYILDH